MQKCTGMALRASREAEMVRVLGADAACGWSELWQDVEQELVRFCMDSCCVSALSAWTTCGINDEYACLMQRAALIAMQCERREVQ